MYSSILTLPKDERNRHHFIPPSYEGKDVIPKNEMESSGKN